MCLSLDLPTHFSNPTDQFTHLQIKFYYVIKIEEELFVLHMIIIMLWTFTYYRINKFHIFYWRQKHLNSKRVYHALLYNAVVLLNVCHQRDLKLDIANLETFCATQHNITLPHTCFCVDLSTHMSIHNWIE